MSKNKQTNHNGFTLLEILLVIGIIGILAAIVIIAINPGRSLAKSRDLQRKVGITEINKGLEQYYIDNNQYPPTITSSLKSICVTGSSATSSGFSCGDLNQVDLSMLVPTYLPSIPVDPTGVGYKIGFNSSRRIILVADLTETVLPFIAIGTTTYPVVLDTSPTIVLGDGSVLDPYQINNWSQLNHVRDDLTKNYILMSSLDSSTFGYAATGASWVPIGNSATPFSGNFNGNGHTISNLTISSPSANYVGLFGYVTGSVSNLGLLNVSIGASSRNFVGALTGYLSAGTVSNSYSSGSVSGYSGVGGLVGKAFNISTDTTVSNCHSAVSVTSFGSLGGLVGYTYGKIYVSNSYSTGSVTATGNTDDYAGGLIGNHYGGTISNSYSTGHVTGNKEVGGFIGHIAGTQYSAASVVNSYSNGIVTGGTTQVGGFIGYLTHSASSLGENITSSYWDQTTSGKTTSAAGTGTTTAGMKTASLYTGWSDSIWNIADGSYPTLKP